MSKWEYRILVIPDLSEPFAQERALAQLKAYGLDGWEAVGISQVGDSWSVLFKRPMTN
jgi:hypothetical protein